MNKIRPVVSIIVPARDEEESIGILLKRMKRVLKKLPDAEVIVVCDNCKDNTRQVAKKLGAITLTREGNPGKSKALIDGFKKARGEILAMLDADLSHLPEHLPKFIRKLESDRKIGLVIGSRIKGGSKDTTPIRYLGGVALSFLTNLLFKLSLTDAINGYKVFRREVFENFTYTSTGYAIEIELIANTIRSNLRVTEISSFEAKRVAGVAKSRIIKDGFLFLKQLIIEWAKFNDFRSWKNLLNVQISLKSILSIFLIIFFTFFLWHKVLDQAIIGEGMIYLQKPDIFEIFWEKEGFKGIFLRYDLQAVLFYHYFSELFRDNFRLYYYLLLSGAALVNLSVYYLIAKVTKSNFSGVFGSLIFLTSYVGNYQMLAEGYYQWFIQRVPNFALIILSFLLFYKFFQGKKFIHWISAFVLFSLAIIFSHYSFVALPLFVFYALLYPLFNKNRIGSFKIAVVSVIPFIAVSAFLIKNQRAMTAGDINPLVFLRSANILGILTQEVVITSLPKDAFISVANNLVKLLDLNYSLTYPDLLMKFGYLIVLSYVILITYSVYRNQNLRVLILTLVLSLITSILILYYLQPNFVAELGTSRYRYFTAMLLSIVLALVTHTIFRKNFVTIITLSLLLFLWIGANKTEIDSNFNKEEERHQIVLAQADFVKKSLRFLPENSLIVLHPYVGGWNAKALERFNSYNKYRIIAEGSPEHEVELGNRKAYKNVVYLRYINKQVLPEFIR